MASAVDLVIQDKVAQVLIKRESSLNALNKGVLQDIVTICAELLASCQGQNAFQKYRSVVIRGEGQKAFVAGADIKHMAEASSAERQEFVELGQSAMNALEALPLPVIASVQGYALGGGMELALACDLIIASDKAVFGQPEVNLGLIPGFGGTQRLIQRCGAGAARRLVLTGENIKADEAFRLGIIDYLTSAEDLDARTDSLAQTLASRGPLALAAAKRSLQSLHGESQAAGLATEAREFMNLFAHDDTKEGLLAFIEKRKAQFRGK